jgi:hypothetical protein
VGVVLCCGERCAQFETLIGGRSQEVAEFEHTHQCACLGHDREMAQSVLEHVGHGVGAQSIRIDCHC